MENIDDKVTLSVEVVETTKDDENEHDQKDDAEEEVGEVVVFQPRIRVG